MKNDVMLVSEIKENKIVNLFLLDSEIDLESYLVEYFGYDSYSMDWCDSLEQIKNESKVARNLLEDKFPEYEMQSVLDTDAYRKRFSFYIMKGSGTYINSVNGTKMQIESKHYILTEDLNLETIE